MHPAPLCFCVSVCASECVRMELSQGLQWLVTVTDAALRSLTSLHARTYIQNHVFSHRQPLEHI